VAKLETDVESLLKFAKIGEFRYRPFAKPDEAAPEAPEAIEAKAPAVEPEPAQRLPVSKPVDAATVDRAKFVEPSAAALSAKTSLSAKFAVLANQPTKVSGKQFLKRNSFPKRALPMLQDLSDLMDKPLMAVFLRLDSEGKKRLHLTK